MKIRLKNRFDKKGKIIARKNMAVSERVGVELEKWREADRRSNARQQRRIVCLSADR